MPYTIADITEFVKDELGNPVIDIELNDVRHIKTSVKKALSKINRHIPNKNKHAITISGSQKQYLIPTNQHPGFMDIVMGDFVRPSETFSANTLENPFVLQSSILSIEGGAGLGQTHAGEYELINGYREDSRKIFSADPIWEGHWERDDTVPEKRKYYIYIDVPEVTVPDYYLFGYEYAWAMTPDDDDATGLLHLSHSLEGWFESYVLANCKIILGSRIRDKFKGLPTPDGADLQTDGETMGQEGKDEVQELNDEIRDMQSQLPSIID